jgi:hypothetical protein
MTSQDYARTDARKRAAATPGVVRAFNNGASFNTIDEIDAFGASLETGVNNLGKRLGLTKGAPYNMREAYDAVHAAEAEATRDYARRRPIVSGAAGIAGAVANPLNKVGIGWVAKGGNLSNVAARSAALGGLNGAASGAGEGRSLEERAGNARNGMIFGAMAGGAAPYVARGLETAASSTAKVAGPRLRALADQIPAPVSQAYTDVVRTGSDVFARGWPPRKPAVVDAVLDAPPLSTHVRKGQDDILQSAPPRFTTTAERGVSGLRQSPRQILDDVQIEKLTQQFVEIGGDTSKMHFNTGRYTGYLDQEDIFRIRGDVLPLEEALHPRSTMSSRAVLAHELGHQNYSGSRVPMGAWNDEFRASYWAAKNIPRLSEQERADLISDAMFRAREAGVPIKPNRFMMGVLYGY